MSRAPITWCSRWSSSCATPPDARDPERPLGETTWDPVTKGGVAARRPPGGSAACASPETGSRSDRARR